MEFLLNRYRNVTVLVLALGAQLFLLAYQVKSREEVSPIRVWAVTGVMPLARLLDVIRAHTIGFVTGYAHLMRVSEQNKSLEETVARLKMENYHLRTELSTSERAKTLAMFAARTPSKTIAARVTGRGPDNSKTLFVDRGTTDGVQKNMAVVTPDGIVGRITAAYPDFSRVVLITDTNFRAGVISQKHRVHGTVKGQGHSVCTIDYIQNEEKVEPGEWFFTSGDDRMFPKGLPVGQVKAARPGKMFFQEVTLVASGLQVGLEEVLIVLDGVHQGIPSDEAVALNPKLLPSPPVEASETGTPQAIRGGVEATDADQILDRYRRIGSAQGHPFGAGGVPNFNIEPPPPPRPAPAPASTGPQTGPEAPAAPPVSAPPALPAAEAEKQP